MLQLLDLELGADLVESLIPLHGYDLEVRFAILPEFDREHSSDILCEFDAEDLQLIFNGLREFVEGRVEIVFLVVPAGTAQCCVHGISFARHSYLPMFDFS